MATVTDKEYITTEYDDDSKTFTGIIELDDNIGVQITINEETAQLMSLFAIDLYSARQVDVDPKALSVRSPEVRELAAQRSSGSVDHKLAWLPERAGKATPRQSLETALRKVRTSIERERRICSLLGTLSAVLSTGRLVVEGDVTDKHIFENSVIQDEETGAIFEYSKIIDELGCEMPSVEYWNRDSENKQRSEIHLPPAPELDPNEIVEQRIAWMQVLFEKYPFLSDDLTTLAEGWTRLADAKSNQRDKFRSKPRQLARNSTGKSRTNRRRAGGGHDETPGVVQEIDPNI
jgi:hypothetical protein